MSTEAVSTAEPSLSDAEIADIERYLDVTRGEALFARGILFVEGEAEEYLVPVLANLLGYDLDELGISVCSVAGTHFLPYVKFFGPNCLDIPFAIVTDADPGTTNSGVRRVRKLLEHLCLDEVSVIDNDDAVIPLANEHGIFVTTHTFEVALVRCGRYPTYYKTMCDLGSAQSMGRAKAWKRSRNEFDTGQMLKDVERIGKGRFAQRWAYHVARNTYKGCPQSVKAAVKYVADHIT